MDKGAIARLQQIANTPFERITYTRAIEILEEVVKSKKKKFEFSVSFLHRLKLVQELSVVSNLREGNEGVANAITVARFWLVACLQEASKLQG